MSRNVLVSKNRLWLSVHWLLMLLSSRYRNIRERATHHVAEMAGDCLPKFVLPNQVHLQELLPEHPGPLTHGIGPACVQEKHKAG